MGAVCTKGQTSHQTTTAKASIRNTCFKNKVNPTLPSEDIIILKKYPDAKFKCTSTSQKGPNLELQDLSAGDHKNVDNDNDTNITKATREEEHCTSQDNASNGSYKTEQNDAKQECQVLRIVDLSNGDHSREEITELEPIIGDEQKQEIVTMVSKDLRESGYIVKECGVSDVVTPPSQLGLVADERVETGPPCTPDTARLSHE